MRNPLAALGQQISFLLARWPVLAAVAADGARLSRWPALDRASPWVALLVGLGIGWRPGVPGATFASSLWTLLPLLALGSSGARWGAPALIGYIAGDLLLHPHRHHGSSSSVETALEVYAPLGIGYVLLAMVLVGNPLTAILTARQLSSRIARRVGAGTGRGVLDRSVLVLSAAVVSLALTWSWAHALPTLLRPVETWQGGRPAGEAAFTVQGREPWLTLLAIVITAATALARATVPSPAATAGATLGPAGGRSRIPTWAKALLRALLITYMLSGLYDTWLDATIFALLVLALTVLRAWLRYKATRWLETVERVPLLVRLLAVIGLSYGLALLVIEPLWRQTDTFRPVLLVSLVSLLGATLVLPARAVRAARSPQPRSPS